MEDIKKATAPKSNETSESSESKPDEARTAGGVTFDDKIDLSQFDEAKGLERKITRCAE
jgi:hypothetical protein